MANLFEGQKDHLFISLWIMTSPPATFLGTKNCSTPFLNIQAWLGIGQVIRGQQDSQPMK